MINAKTHRKFEKAADMKFAYILHKGSYGNWALCARKDGTVWGVDKRSGEKTLDARYYYKNGGIFLDGKAPVDTLVEKAIKIFKKGIKWLKRNTNHKPRR